MSLLTLLIIVFVFCIVYWAATKLMTAFGIGEPVHTVVIVILVVLFLFVLLGELGIGPGIRLR